MQLSHNMSCFSIMLEAAVVFLSFQKGNEFPYPLFTGNILHLQFLCGKDVRY
jgi:hypothetical protein